MGKNSWKLENIPEILHLYWGGKKDFSFLRYMTILSFHKLNPNWEIRIHIPADTNDTLNPKWSTGEHGLSFSGENYYGDMLEYCDKYDNINIFEFELDLNDIELNLTTVQKSDIYRWYLLADIGGVWSDFDIIYTKPMNEIYLNTYQNRNIKSVICDCFQTNTERYLVQSHAIGFLMSSGNNQLFWDIYNDSMGTVNSNYQSAGADLLNVSYKYLLIRDVYDGVVNLDTDTVYPYDWRLIHQLFEPFDGFIPKNTIGIHWYAGAKEVCKINNYLNKDNYLGHPSYITEQIKRILN
tara:strand:- start:41214 stop:42098 length:885 start_codon:yes stop_codon:yes gene_type:complete